MRTTSPRELTRNLFEVTLALGGKPAWRRGVTDWLAALSLANLVFLRCWAELLSADGTQLYWLDSPPGPAQHIALMSNVLLMSAAFYVFGRALRQRRRVALRAAPLLALLIALALLNSLRTLVRNPASSLFLQLGQQKIPILGVALATGVVATLVFGGTRALRPVYKLLLALAPFVLVTFAQSIYHIVTYNADLTRAGPFAARLAPRPPGAPRVVWIIFDEWDQPLTFAERPARIHLPEIDRLRQTSLWAGRALRPNLHTDWSMPALTTGRPIADVHPAGPSELMIRPKGSSTFLPWSRQDNVFRDARTMGYNTAAVAWAIPYCRVLKSDLSACWSWSGSNQGNSTGNTALEMLINQPRSLYETIYHSPFGMSLSTARHIRVHKQVLTKALEVVRDRSFGLTLLHMPVPHPPYFYNASTGRNDRGAMPIKGIFEQTQEGYLDALVLTDHVIGELRRAMEQAGLWDSTTVIVSSDHPLRHRQRLDGQPVSMYVPYLIKMAGARRPISYTAEFSSLLTRKLIGAILSGELSDADQLTGWLDANHERRPAASDN